MINQYTLPVSVEIDGVEHKIRDDCDYRIVLECISALNDIELPEHLRLQCALTIFYEDYARIGDPLTAITEMFKIINYGDEEQSDGNKPRLMDWEHDFRQLAPPISRALGYDIRRPQYTHWWTFLGGYMEIGGECTFATIISIRAKRAKGKKLDKHEEEFLHENRKMVNLPTQLTHEDEDFLFSDE